MSIGPDLEYQKSQLTQAGSNRSILGSKRGAQKWSTQVERKLPFTFCLNARLHTLNTRILPCFIPSKMAVFGVFYHGFWTVSSCSTALSLT